jgi:hypothetical protein
MEDGRMDVIPSWLSLRQTAVLASLGQAFSTLDLYVETWRGETTLVYVEATENNPIRSFQRP